ncbi:MAG: lipase [Paenibacillaceae bacterium]|nr:lipase [Paenibacillaceae bacterium]
MPMDVHNVREKRAIFLAAVCSQTYEQYANQDGTFMVPSHYSLRHTILAQSIGNKWERFGFIIESPREIVIAFRGTSSRNDWISDAMAAQIKFKYVRGTCLVHRGFANIYASARKGIHSALAKLPPDKSLTVTGHSLGAALATLCALDLAVNTPSRSPKLFTYGSPRVGDPAFARVFSQNVSSSYRFANPFDLVTHAPPTVLKLPVRDKTYYYSHVKSMESVPFQKGSIELNHIISSYFAKLSRSEPDYSRKMCSANPGFCPD